MKVRVKGTNDIIDVELYHRVGDTSWYITKYQTQYSEEDLEFIDEHTDYWTRLEHQYAGMAMQILIKEYREAQGKYKLNDKLVHETCAKESIEFAHALVKKLKEKEERK